MIVKNWLINGFFVASLATVGAAWSNASPSTPPPVSIEPLLDALRRGSEVQQQGTLDFLGSNQRDVPTFQNLYNTACHGGPGTFNEVSRWSIILPPFACERGEYNYWEPAAIVEVSCQKGFSFLKPGLAGSGRSNVQPPQCGQGPHWFFEARVWASNPQGWGDRAQIFGEGGWDLFGKAKCSGKGTKGASQYPFGYGIKYERISGAMNSAPDGPAGSITAYISDNDPTWFEQLNPANPGASLASATIPAERLECQPGQPNVEACWGDQRQASGWVTHPNRAVAAALVSLRAVRKAQGLNRVATDLQGGLKMSMDYPFVKAASEYGQGMGLPGAIQNRHRGSDCFMIGEGGPGPWWAVTGRRNDENITLQQAVPTLAASADTGTYIFTYWVRTGCTVYNSPICGSDDYQF